MKLKQVEAILKANKTIMVYETEYCQWLGNSEVFYPIYNLPKLTRNNIFALFDIPEDKKDKYFLMERDLPKGINFDDMDNTEVMITRENMSFFTQGCLYEPLRISTGIAFIKERYLKPFSDEENGIELYERITENGYSYIAVKSGFCLLGIITPCDIVNVDFVKQLEILLGLSKIALLNKKSGGTKNEHSSDNGAIDRPS